ncbi:hypothetical protein DSCW_10180 [Desulfosarcina widdelii]|uniref:DUF2760 domain-containing protein n=1 Tax=Desulfosarcina widdelii TaxID=947919 RepID=A0A5K7Z259_9BACT|nr:DUF2760 domain-containing protein [Desulfosarcina widdelii]BBO73601.1 hypothetical protein DSCW_10180 [Desulfosarcina widdelii]
MTKQPSLRRTFALRSLVQFLVFASLLSAVAVGLHWYSLDAGIRPNFRNYALLFAFLILFSLLQWMFLKNTLSKLLARSLASSTPKNKRPTTPREDEVDRKKRENENKRLFVHLFAVLQREGRLMDFLQEDLDRYEDAQIGAAVRSIHANCKQTVKRYLSPEPVMRQQEGETVEIEAGFDRQAIKLTGNVGDQPPFTGILRHRGWQLKSVALPKLAETENADFIAPAEVEIL